MKRTAFLNSSTRQLMPVLAAGLLTLLGTACSGAASSGGPASGKTSGGTLRIAMTAGDIPLTDGQPDQGFEGYRFVGYQLYNGLTKWDYEQGDHPPVAAPALAESWAMDPKDPTKWTFKLRQGVKFHDGTDFNADSVIWAIDRVKKPDAPQYNAAQAVTVGVRINLLKSWKKLDDYSVEIISPAPSQYVPEQMLYLMIPSRTAIEKYGKDDYPKYAAGTGPFKLASITPRQSAEFVRNEEYWGTKAKLDKVVLLPMAEASTRLAALRSGQADWIEVPPPDAVAGLTKDGYNLVTKEYPHVWPYQLDTQKAPWDNLKIRQAAMYAIDREGMCKGLLANTCIPAYSMIYPGHPWYGNPTQYKYDPEKARQLIKESGMQTPIKTKLLTSPSGSGQMLPLPMNEFIQRNFKEVGIDMEIELIEWNAMGARTRDGFVGPSAANTHFNSSSASVDAYSAFARFFHSKSVPPTGSNRAAYKNPEVDRLMDEAETTVSVDERNKKLARVNELLSQDLPWIFIVHDLNPRVLSKRVKDFTQAQSWFVSLSEVWVQ